MLTTEVMEAVLVVYRGLRHSGQQQDSRKQARQSITELALLRTTLQVLM